MLQKKFCAQKGKSPPTANNLKEQCLEKYNLKERFK